MAEDATIQALISEKAQQMFEDEKVRLEMKLNQLIKESFVPSATEEVVYKVIG